MMPETVAEMAAGHRVALAVLFEFEFASATQRFWDGIGYLNAGGRTWLGFGDMGSVSGLEQSSNGSAAPASFTLSGVSPEIINLAVKSASEVTGRPCAAYIQFLTKQATPLDDPIAIWAGNMDVMSFRGDIGNQIVSLSAETLFVNRIRSPFGYLTDTDQQARYPGDRGLEFVASLRNKTVKWLFQ